MSTAVEPADGVADVAVAAGPPASPAIVYLARLAPGSRRTMRQALDAIAELLTTGRADALSMPWHQLRYVHTQAVRAALEERLAWPTVNKHLSAMRGVLREAWLLGLMGAEDYHRAIAVENIRGERVPAGRHVEVGEISALSAVCAADRSPAGPRDGAMLAVAFAGGLRRAELVALDLVDVSTGTGEVLVREGKGRKARTAYVAGGALAALTDWITVRGDEPGALFCPVSQRGVVSVRRMSGQALYARVVRRARQAGVPLVSPHDGRRTWIGELLAAGADVSTVQKMAGHAQVSTTVGYDRRGEQAKKDAAALLHFPWQGQAGCR